MNNSDLINKGIEHFSSMKDNKKNIEFGQSLDVVCLLVDWKWTPEESYGNSNEDDNMDTFQLTHQYLEKDKVDGKWYPFQEWKSDVRIEKFVGKNPTIYIKKNYDIINYREMELA